MKHLLAAAIAFTFAASAVQAQTLSAGATSSSGSLAAAGANNAITFNSKAPRNTEARIESAPSLGGLALGGGHPCAWSPATGQISIIGGGAGFGGMTIDSACLLLMQAIAAGDRRAYDAAMYMIAARDPDACEAMDAVGMIVCGKAEATPVSTRNAAPATAPVLYSKCALEGKQIKIRYTAAGRADKPAAAAACQRALGY